MTEKKNNHPLKDFYKDIYGRYDLVNRIFTFGRDKYWRSKAVKECLLNAPRELLDICTGTGDLAIEMAEKAAESTSVTGYDFTTEMLKLAREKAVEKFQTDISQETPESSTGGGDAVEYAAPSGPGSKTEFPPKNSFAPVFIEGDVADMPFENGHFDTAGISFGIRNLVYENSNADRHLAEIHRVLRGSGRFVILESSKPENILWRFVNSIYLRFILPYLGGIISGNFKAYRYLARSSKNYYSKTEMGQILEKAGFKVIRSSSLFLGSVMLIVAEKQPSSSKE